MSVLATDGGVPICAVHVGETGMFPRRSSNAGFHRFDAAHVIHTGLKAVHQEDYRTWEMVLEHCTLGMTLRRDRYSVKISDTTAAREEYLTGFPSRIAAMQAARRRIDFILDIQDPRRPRRRPRAS